ncbi:MAG TPA: VOC family protein [Stellaceae bacterium]|nr:VOC family protein [Stellaceae bacterium]
MSKRLFRRLSLAVAMTVAAIAAPVAASADGLPTLRGHDHTGITVPSMKDGLDFFVGVMGCKQAMSFGPFADDKGTFMADHLNVNPRAVIKQITMVRCGTGSNIELFEYASPDQKTDLPKNSDVGGYHIAFYVDDIAKATAYLKAKGIKTLADPLPVKDGPAAGQTILYFLTPWGMQLELITYPKGMAYAKTSKVKLWSPTAPGK